MFECRWKTDFMNADFQSNQEDHPNVIICFKFVSLIFAKLWMQMQIVIQNHTQTFAYILAYLREYPCERMRVLTGINIHKCFFFICMRPSLPKTMHIRA